MYKIPILNNPVCITRGQPVTVYNNAPSTVS